MNDFARPGLAEEKLPPVNASDNGKVLGVNNGAWDKVNASSGLPSVTSDDNGDVLTVVEGAWGKAAPGGTLPAVTSDDNGDVLTVVNGAWDKAAPSGGGGVLDVNITTTDWAHGTADKTFEEMTAAINAGYVINAKIVGENYFIPLMLEVFSRADITLNSITFLVSDNLLEVYEATIGDDNIVLIGYHTYTLTPAT